VRLLRVGIALATLLLVACTKPRGGDRPDGSAPAHVAASASKALAADLLRERPYVTHAPEGYRAHGPAPLVLVLCGYDAAGGMCDGFFGFREMSSTESFVDVVLDGSFDAAKRRFWNATDACCNKFGSDVDDVAYVRAVLDDVTSKESIDPKRVFVFGFSNGGFFAHRLGCEMSERIAAIASIAGATWNDPARCTPTSAVSVVEIHGDADEVVPYAGGHLPFDAGVPPGALPGARATVGTWAQKDACTGALEHAGERDLDTKLPGEETGIERYAGCPGGVGVELWTVRGGKHVPNENDFGKAVYGFFMAHPKT
jgi:polyhydroxybutyrate depolymerase